MGVFYLVIHTNLYTNEVKWLLIIFNYTKKSKELMYLEWHEEKKIKFQNEKKKGMKYILHVIVKIKADNRCEKNLNCRTLFKHKIFYLFVCFLMNRHHFLNPYCNLL